MTVAAEVLAYVATNPLAVSLDGTTNENLLAACVEHYRARNALGGLGLSYAPTLVGQQYAAVTRSSNNSTDTAFQVLASVVMPAGTMGPNSKLVIIPDWDYTNSGSTKHIYVDFGGTNISAVTATTTGAGVILLEVKNLNSLVLQKTFNGSSYGLTSNTRVSSTIDTAGEVTIDFKVKWTANVLAETISLLGYSVYHWPGNA